jgi:4-diphosphocytidyl-2-C-methyl-D-erythritol kinase
VTEPDAVAWPAPAKINLFLHVTGRRADGYHNLQTLFQLLDWGDGIEVRRKPGPVVSRAPVDYGVAESEDLVVRAAKRLQQATGCRQGAEILVRKRIPPGSGLGGGSSDAATVLLALNRLWNCGLDTNDLAALGRGLGADVPVFVHGRSALAEGIGDQLQPVRLGDRHYVLVFPGFSVSTAEVFADAGLARDSAPISLEEALAGGGWNDCEPVVLRRFPELATLMESLARWGRPAMTGTGSTIFIPMPDRANAMSAANEMKTLYNVRAVRGVDESPVLDVLYSD